MKRKNLEYKHILVLCFVGLLSCFGARGQNKINPTVEVNRNYETKLLRSTKSKIDTDYADSLHALKLDFDYLVLNRPYKDLYDFTPMQSLHLHNQGTYLPPVFHLKAGVGYLLDPDVSLYFAPRLGERFSLSVSGRHDSFWGKRPLQDGSKGLGDEMRNNADIRFGYSWKTGQLALYGGYSNNYYAYFGDNNGNKISRYFRDSLSHTYNAVDAGFSIKSTNPSASSFYYDVNLYYLRGTDKARVKYFDDFGQTRPLHENNINADVSLGGVIHTRHKIFLDAVSRTLIYTDAFSATRGIFEISPKYSYDADRINLVAGLSFANSYGTDKDTHPVETARLYPQLSVIFEAARNKFWIFAKVDGENRFNSFHTMMTDNHWISSMYGFNTINTSIPIRARLGFNGRAGGKFGYSLYGGYYKAKNLFSYSIDATMPIQVADPFDSEVAEVGAELRWKSTDFAAKLDASYNKYLAGLPYMLPEFEGRFYAQYNYRKRFYAEVDCFYRTTVRAKSTFDTDYLISGFVDLDLKFSYALNPTLSFFLEGRNILNQHLQYYQNYFDPGINFALGVCLKL